MNLYEYNCVDTEHWPGLAELRPDDGGTGAVQQTVEYRQQYRPSHPQAVLTSSPQLVEHFFYFL